MAIDDLGHDIATRTNPRDRLISVYIAVLAVVLAICALGGNNATKEAMGKNIEVANTWAFFQAKNMRRHTLRLQIDDLETFLATQPGLDDTARTTISETIARYRQQDTLLTSEPATGEGLDELFAKAKRLEAERDVALERDPYFDYGQAVLQIAIVLASVAIISGGSTLLVASALLGLLGGIFTVNGFTMLWQLPFIN